VLALRHRYTVIVVRGRSMMPTLREGEKVLARRVQGQTVRSGDIVILRVPGLGTDGTPNRYTAVKRVAATGRRPASPVPAAPDHDRQRTAPRRASRRARRQHDGKRGLAAVGLVPAANVLAKVVRTLY
jgi:hypothetical protein